MGEKGVENKIQRFCNTCRIINRTLGNKAEREIKLELDKVMAVHILLYRSET
jgi:Fe-S cluster biogenesis protein NfuA